MGQNYRSWVDEVSEALGRIRSEAPTQQTVITPPEGVDIVRTKDGGILITREEQ